MSKYDQEYYVIDPANSDRLPRLTPTEETVDRNYAFEVPPRGSAPFFFFNGASDYQKKKRIDVIKDLPDVLFNGNHVIVRDRVRKELLELDASGFELHPAVFMDDDGTWHEDFWFVCIPERFDCWDKEASDYDDDPMEIGGFELYEIEKISLSEELLDRTPLKERLFFKLGGAQDAVLMCHQSIAGIFRSPGSKLIPVPDY
ncbi:hypothetical protein IP91_01995 [Pseudoduganella lurida]|uniref:Immunity MXAN-0049 protein domain-containing protein n=1 Tax=Pseudoduganella lurida TaxID=1036180 RepID=A0A562RC79_9BURK|nr:DUF1629 domain-containing protein [Pseudoduganella lurida]TWI66184.1 hypothetical protein IP91_01995 [Pseudoduganella lurida]